MRLMRRGPLPESSSCPFVLNMGLVFMEFGKQRDQFRISMQTPVDNPLMTIESFNKQFQIGEKERETVKWGWEREMGNSMFRVVNAYTQGTQFEGLSAEAGYRSARQVEAKHPDLSS